MRRPPAGSPGPTAELAALAQAWAKRTSLDQHLPAKITDQTALLAVAAILGAASPHPRRGRRRRPARTPRCQTRQTGLAGVIERVASVPGGRADNHVVEYR